MNQVTKRGPYKFTAVAREVALRVFAETGNAAAAASAAGISESHLRGLRAQDDELRQEWEEARAAFVAALEREAYRRAVDGWDEERLGPGGRLYTVRKFDSQLLIALLRANAPHRYRDTVHVEQTNITDKTTPIGLDQLSPESRAQLREILEREKALAEALPGRVRVLEGPTESASTDAERGPE